MSVSRPAINLERWDALRARGVVVDFPCFLAPMVGLECPMRPERGQIVVTERLRPFLRHPVVTLRQTDEGTVMIGDSKEERTDPTGGVA